MALKDVLKDIEGYQEIADEIQVLRKYGSDYSSSKGVVEHIISLLHPKRITLKLSEVIKVRQVRARPSGLRQKVAICRPSRPASMSTSSWMLAE